MSSHAALRRARYRAIGALALLVASSGAVAGCEDTGIATGRGDSGVAPGDAGFDGELALRAGWSFRYLATLTRREGAREAQTGYNLTLTIDSIDDQGIEGESSLLFAGTGTITPGARNWDQTAGADSWVARLGPAHPADRVIPNLRRARLIEAPQPPPFAATKELPAIRPFFLDMRRIEALRTEFRNTYPAGMKPGTLEPSDTTGGTWQFRLDGEDTTLVYYTPGKQNRFVELAYDPRGFLKTLSERLGDSHDRVEPHGSFDLRLVSDNTED